MPRATFDSNESEKYDLKTCPGGYVVIQRLSYGDFLHRQEMAIQMKVEGGNRANRRSGHREPASASMGLINKKVTQYEFENCIIDHNLEDASGEKLDFADISTLDMLDPKIGNEIGQIINDLHQFEEDLGN